MSAPAAPQINWKKVALPLLLSLLFSSLILHLPHPICVPLEVPLGLLSPLKCFLCGLLPRVPPPSSHSLLRGHSNKMMFSIPMALSFLFSTLLFRERGGGDGHFYLHYL